LSDQDETQPYDIYLGHIASPPQRVEVVDAGGNDPVTVSTTVANAINQFGAIDRVQFEGKIEQAMGSTEIALREGPNGEISDASVADAGSHDPIKTFAVGDRVIYTNGDQQTENGGQRGIVKQVDDLAGLVWVQFDSFARHHGWYPKQSFELVAPATPIADDRTGLERIADDVELESKNLGSDEELPYVVQSTVNEADEDDPLGYDKQHTFGFGEEPWSLNSIQKLGEYMGNQRGMHYVVVDENGEKTRELQEKIERVRELAKEIGYDASFWELPANPWKPEVALLQEAKQTITSDRQDQYGDAEDSFSTIGQFWTTFLRARHPRLEIPHIKGSDVALMLDLMKTARQAVTQKHDNLVDKAGYTALAARCIAKEASE